MTNYSSNIKGTNSDDWQNRKWCGAESLDSLLKIADTYKWVWVNLRRNCKCALPLKTKGVTSALKWGDAPLVKLCVKEGILRTVKKEYIYFFWGQGQRTNEACSLKLAFFSFFLWDCILMFLHNRNPKIKFQSCGHDTLIQPLHSHKKKDWFIYLVGGTLPFNHNSGHWSRTSASCSMCCATVCTK